MRSDSLPGEQALKFQPMFRRLHCLIALLSMGLAFVGCAGGIEDGEIGAGRAVRRPNILIYLVDTLRPDRLGCYGYERPASPHVDAFADEATLFENAIGQSSWTRASMASIFTGVWPPTHGTTGWKHQLPEAFETLTEKLDAAGYETAAFVGNPQITVRYGFGQGCDRFDEEIKRPSADYNEMAAEWLHTLTGEDGTQAYQLYNWVVDTGETRDLAAEQADRRAPRRARGLGIPAIG